jgi:hypothetical protein
MDMGYREGADDRIVLPLLIGVLATLVVSAPLTARAGVIHVPAGEPTIQAGIDAAAVGDTVLVAPGFYTGPGNRDLDFHGNDLALRSEAGAYFTIIFAGGSEGNPHRTFDFHSGESTAALVEGFAITGGWVTSASPVDMGAGVLCRGGSSPTISSCVFEGNSAHGTGGGLAVIESSPVVRDCTFELNEVRHPHGDGGGIFSWGSTLLLIEDCRFVQNRAHEGGGVCVATNSNVIVRRSIFAFNEATALAEGGGGIIVVNAYTLIENCTFIGNISYFEGYTVAAVGCTGYFQRNIIVGSTGCGLLCSGGFYADCNDVWASANQNYVGCPSTPTNFSADPQFCDAPTLDLTLRESSPCAPAHSPGGCGLIGAFDVGCGPVAIEGTTWGRIKAQYQDRSR